MYTYMHAKWNDIHFSAGQKQEDHKNARTNLSDMDNFEKNLSKRGPTVIYANEGFNSEAVVKQMYVSLSWTDSKVKI